MSTHRKQTHLPLQTPTTLFLPGQAIAVLSKHFIDDTRPALSRGEIMVLDAGERHHSIIVWNMDDRTIENLIVMHTFDSILTPSADRFRLVSVVEPFLNHMRSKPVGVGMIIPKPDGTTRRIVSRLFVNSSGSVETAMVGGTQLLPNAVRQAFGLDSWKPNGVVGGRFLSVSDGGFFELPMPFLVSSNLMSKSGGFRPSEDSSRLVFFALGYGSPVPPYELLHMLIDISSIVPNPMPHVLVYGHPTAHTIDISAWSITTNPTLLEFLPSTFAEAKKQIQKLEVGQIPPHTYPQEVLVAISKKWATIFPSLAGCFFMRVAIVDETGSRVEAIPLPGTHVGVEF